MYEDSEETFYGSERNFVRITRVVFPSSLLSITTEGQVFGDRSYGLLKSSNQYFPHTTHHEVWPLLNSLYTSRDSGRSFRPNTFSLGSQSFPDRRERWVVGVSLIRTKLFERKTTHGYMIFLQYYVPVTLWRRIFYLSILNIRKCPLN